MTAEEARTFEVEVQVRVRAAPETVFPFLVDPAKYPLWQGVSAELDPRPGGLYRVVMDESNVARGEYLVVEPPHRVMFTWGFEGNPDLPPGATTVEVTLAPEAEETIITVRHMGLPTEEQRSMHEQGWQLYLARLTDAVTSPG